jgi:hypothetical protein
MPVTITPALASAIAIATIKNTPENWNQGCWHEARECGTCHCWAGHIDLILGEEAVYRDLSDVELGEDIGLVNNVQGFLGLNDTQWDLITKSTNTIQQLEAYHKEFFGTDASQLFMDFTLWEDPRISQLSLPLEQVSGVDHEPNH